MDDSPKIPEIVAAVMFAASVVVLALAYRYLPEAVPTSFDASGAAQAFGPKWTVWLPLAGGILSYVAIGLAARTPERFLTLPNITITDENRDFVVRLIRQMCSWLKMWVLTVIFAIVCMVVQGALTGHARLDIVLFFYGALGGMVVTLIAFAVKLRGASA